MFSIFRKAFSKLKEDSTEGERLFREGYAQAHANQHDKAIELFTQSIEISDIYPTPFIGRGASYAYQERYLEAWDDYSRALQMETEDPSPSAKENLNALRQNMRAIEPLMVLNNQNGDGVRQLLVSDGLDYFTKRWVEQLLEKLSNKPTLIRHFVLEEMAELYQLGGKYKEVALNSGFKSSEYLNLKESKDTTEAFFLMKNILCCFSRDSDKMLMIRVEILKKLSNTLTKVFSGGMRLKEAEVDILFIVKNDKVLYINTDCTHLFKLDNDGHEILDGRVVNMTYIGQSDKNIIEVFVGFDDADSYTMFTERTNLNARLNYVCQDIFRYFAENNITDILSFTEMYSTKHIYAFKLYRVNERYFMVNHGQTQAYLIDKNGIERDNVDAIKARFWVW